MYLYIAVFKSLTHNLPGMFQELFLLPLLYSRVMHDIFSLVYWQSTGMLDAHTGIFLNWPKRPLNHLGDVINGVATVINLWDFPKHGWLFKLFVAPRCLYFCYNSVVMFPFRSHQATLFVSLFQLGVAHCFHSSQVKQSIAEFACIFKWATLSEQTLQVWTQPTKSTNIKF